MQFHFCFSSSSTSFLSSPTTDFFTNTPRIMASVSTMPPSNGSSSHKIITLKLPPSVLRTISQKSPSLAAPVSAPTSRPPSPSKPGPKARSPSKPRHAQDLLSTGPSSRVGSPGPGRSGAGGAAAAAAAAASVSTSIAAGGSGGAGSARFTGMMALKGLDRSGSKNPVRRWRKAPIDLKSFTGFKYTLTAWNGGTKQGGSAGAVASATGTSTPTGGAGLRGSGSGAGAGASGAKGTGAAASRATKSNSASNNTAASTPALSVFAGDSAPGSPIAAPDSPYPSSGPPTPTSISSMAVTPGAVTPIRAATPPLPGAADESAALQKLSAKPPASINLKNGGSQLAQSPMTMSNTLPASNGKDSDDEN